MPIRKYVAIATDSPTPVPIATYSAMHAGHFGNSTRTALGNINPAKLRAARFLDAAGRGSPLAIRAPLRGPRQSRCWTAGVEDVL